MLIQISLLNHQNYPMVIIDDLWHCHLVKMILSNLYKFFNENWNFEILLTPDFFQFI